MVIYKNISCTTRKSKNNPNGYSKEELIELAIKKGITKSKALKSTKEEICNLLNKLSSSIKKSSEKSIKKSSIKRIIPKPNEDEQPVVTRAESFVTRADYCTYILRSNEPMCGNSYRWMLRQDLPLGPINTRNISGEDVVYKTYKEYSREVLSGKCCLNLYFKYLYYADVHTDSRTNKLINLFLGSSVFETGDIDNLLSMFSV